MKERISMKAGNMLYPLPVVLVSCGDETTGLNIITIAWAGTICTNPPMLSISVRPERHSYELIKKTGTFVVNLPLAEMSNEVDLCGVKSGRNINKFETCRFTPSQSQHIDTPGISECPVSIECIVKQEIHLGSHIMFISEVVGVSAWKSLLNTKTNSFEIGRLPLLTYSHGGYFTLGMQTGHFGFSVKRKGKTKK